MFIVKNETFTGLILMAWLLFFLYRRALQMRYIGLLRRPDLSTTGLVSAFRVLAPWLLLKQDILSEACYISKRCDFHRSACSLPSNGKLAHRAFQVLCGRCVNWPAFSLSFHQYARVAGLQAALTYRVQDVLLSPYRILCNFLKY